MPPSKKQAEALDRKSNQYVLVSGDWCSINGCEPVPIPEEFRGQEPKKIARQLLRLFLDTRSISIRQH